MQWLPLESVFKLFEMEESVVTEQETESKTDIFLVDAVTIGSAPNCDIIFNDTQVAPQNSRVFVRNQMINAVQPKLIGVAGREVVCLC